MTPGPWPPTGPSRSPPRPRGGAPGASLLILGLLVSSVAGSKPSPPPGAGGAAPVPAALRAALRRNVTQYSRAFRRCHELAMAEDLRAGGRITLELVVAPAGVVVEILIQANPSGNALFGRCLVEVTRGFVFPASGGHHRLPITLGFAKPQLKLTVRLDDVPARATGERGVSVKSLLGPHNVTGDRLGLVVARLEKGSSLALGGLPAVVGVHVLEGSVRLEPDAPFPLPALLLRGEGASLARAGAAAKLVNLVRGRSAALLFLAPGEASRHWHGPRTPAPPSGARPRRSGPVLARAAPQVVTMDLSLGPSALPVPHLVEVAPGERARLNPTGSDLHHALLVTEGVLRVTIGGESLHVEVGMALYLPGKMVAEAVALRGQKARLVLMPWPGTGAWNPRAVHPLVRFTPASRPMPRHP